MSNQYFRWVGKKQFCLCTLLGLLIFFRYSTFPVRLNALFGLPSLEKKKTYARVYPLSKTENDNSLRNRSDDFLDNWFRLHKARMDWQGILVPCWGNTDWGVAKPGWGKTNRTSGRHSYVADIYTGLAGEFTRMFIQTGTRSGTKKDIGGDSWRVHFRGPSSVSATVFDHGNGTYEAVALLMESGEYSVEAILDYSLCDGLKEPPENWFRIGNAQGKYQADGILGYLDDYLLEPLQGGKTITVKILPNMKSASQIQDFSSIRCHETCSSLWHGYGRWIKNDWWPYVSENHSDTDSQPTSLPGERKETLWIYGDSLALRLLNSLSSKPLCSEVFSSCRYSYNWVYPVPHDNDQMAKALKDDLDFRPWLVLDSIRNVLRREDMRSNMSLLVLNLGLHFPIGISLKAYQSLIRDVIWMLKHREEELGSRAKVVWKTSTAIHKEKVEEPRNSTHWRFFTDQRVRLFDAFAMSAMCTAGIEVLDVYPLTASYPSETPDVVHYDNKVFSKAEMEIQRYATAETSAKPRQVCTG